MHWQELARDSDNWDVRQSSAGRPYPQQVQCRVGRCTRIRIDRLIGIEKDRQCLIDKEGEKPRLQGIENLRLINQHMRVEPLILRPPRGMVGQQLCSVEEEVLEVDPFRTFGRFIERNDGTFPSL